MLVHQLLAFRHDLRTSLGILPASKERDIYEAAGEIIKHSNWYEGGLLLRDIMGEIARRASRGQNVNREGDSCFVE